MRYKHISSTMILFAGILMLLSTALFAGYSASPTSTTNGDSYWGSSILRMSVSISGTNATFTVQKTSGTFSSNCAVYLKVGTYESYGVNRGSGTIYAGQSQWSHTHDLSAYSYPKTFYFRVVPTSGGWAWAGPITVSFSNSAPSAPTISSSPTTATVGQTVYVTMWRGTDPDGDQVKIQATGTDSNRTNSSPYVSGWSSGGTSTTASFIFNSAGTKTIYATTFDIYGNGSTNRSRTITVTNPNRAPNSPTISSSPTSAIVGQSVSITMWRGTDPDGDQVKIQATGTNSNRTNSAPYISSWSTGGTSTTATFTFSAAGTQTIWATTFDINGSGSSPVSRTISVENPNSAPNSPTISSSPTSAIVGQSVSITMWRGTDPDGDQVKIQATGTNSNRTNSNPYVSGWSTGGTSTTATFTFSAAGTQTIWATTFDVNGNGSSPVSRTIIVEDSNSAPNPPTIDSSPGTAIVGQSVSITMWRGTDPDGDQVKIQATASNSNRTNSNPYVSGWSTGGASTTATFTFSAAGTQTIWATTFDINGNGSSPISRTIIVEESNSAPNPPTIDSSPGTAIVGQSVSITMWRGTDPDGDQVKIQATASNSNRTDSAPYISSWSTGGTSTTATFTFSAAGTQTIWATTFDVNGNGSSPVSRTITVDEGLSSTRFNGNHFIDQTAKIGIPLLMEAKLEETQTSNPIVGETVHVEIFESGSWQEIPDDGLAETSLVTDSNGVANVYYTPPQNLAPGDYQIRASYDGNNNYNSCELTRTLTVNGISWILMYYMCNGGNLDACMEPKFRTLANNLPHDSAEIFVLSDRLSSTDYVFRLKNDDNPDNYIDGLDRWIPQDIGIAGDEFDTGDVNTLNAFTNFVISNNQADHYALIIFNHGGGVYPTPYQEDTYEIVPTGIAFDAAGSYLSTSELGQGAQNIASQLGKNLEVLQLDACLMQMAEINYEVKNSVDYLIASENLGWASTGVWSWETYISNITSNTTALDLSLDIANTYFNWASIANNGRTISVTDIGNIEAVKTAVDNLSTALINNLSTIYSQVEIARTNAQKFSYFDTANTMTNSNMFLDLRDFCEELRDNVANNDVVTAAINVIAAVGDPGGNFIRMEDHQNSPNATVNAGFWFDRGTYGISIFFPVSESGQTYSNYINDSNTPANLLFTADTNWDEFLIAYFGGVPPEAPSDLQATAVSSTQIDLSWTDNSNDENGFKIERKTGPSGTYSQIGTANADITSYQDTGLTPNTTYYYKVRAYNDNGDSTYSNEAQTTTPDCPVPPPPDGLSPCGNETVTSPVTLSWNPVNGAVFYRVIVFAGGNCINLLNETIVSAPSSSFTVTLPSIGDYSWHIIAVNDCGESIPSQCCNFQVVCPSPSVPLNPSPANGATSISIDTNLDWDDCVDAGSYDVYFGTSYPPLYYGSTTESFYDLPQLEYGTQYHWKIVAKNACGDTPGADWNFTTEEYAMPHISSLNPSEGPIGTTVIILGSDFGIDEGTVTFNGVNSVVDSWNETQIETTVPQGASTGPVVVHTLAGQDSNGVTFTVTEQPTAKKADFDRDGNADVIWRYQGPEGYNAVWLSGNASSTTSAAGISSTNEVIKEMNRGIGKPGVVLTNSSWATLPEARRHSVIDGFAGMDNWSANSSPSPNLEAMSRVAAASVFDPRNDPQNVNLDTVADQNWKLAGTGDFNGDGNIDIAWSNVGTAHNCVWYMDGANFSGYAQLPDGSTTDWVLGGVGDFDRDGNPDLIWHNVIDGRNGVWYLDGVQLKGIDIMTTGANVDWQLCGTGDFNNDSHADLVWRNISDGRNAVWYMDGVELSSVDWLDTVADQNWKLRGTGDFNNDGKIDLIWTYISDGRNCIWHLDGITLTNVTLLTTVTDTTWMIRNQ